MKEMTTQEIIRESDEIKKSKSDWRKVYAAVYTSVQQNTHRVLRHGNTLAWIMLLPNEAAQMFIFNADTPQNFLRNMKEFARALDKSGFKKVIGETTHPKIIEVIKQLGYPVQVETIGVDAQGRPVYRGTVNV